MKEEVKFVGISGVNACTRSVSPRNGRLCRSEARARVESESQRDEAVSLKRLPRMHARRVSRYHTYILSFLLSLKIHFSRSYFFSLSLFFFPEHCCRLRERITSWPGFCQFISKLSFQPISLSAESPALHENVYFVHLH